jgi:DNA-binding MarR family transcriptional regulator
VPLTTCRLKKNSVVSVVIHTEDIQLRHNGFFKKYSYDGTLSCYFQAYLMKKSSLGNPDDIHFPSPPFENFDPIRQVLWSRPGFLVRRLNQIHYAIFSEECKEHAITPVQFGVLTALSLKPTLDQTEVGTELGLDRTTTADVLKRLEEKNLIERRPHPADRRSRQSLITEEGFSVMKLLHTHMQRSQQRLLSPLSQQDQQIFIELLTKLVESNNKYSRAPARSSL